MGKFVCHRTQQISERWSKPKTCIEKEHNREQKMIYLPAFGASYPSFRHLLRCYFVIVGRSAQSVYPMTEIESKHSDSLSLSLWSWQSIAERSSTRTQFLNDYLLFSASLFFFKTHAYNKQSRKDHQPNTIHSHWRNWNDGFRSTLDFFCGRRSSTEEEEEKKNGFYFSYVTDFRIEKQQKKIHHSPKRIVFLFFFVRRGCVTRTVVHSHTQPYKRESCISTRARILSTWHFRKKQTTIYCCSWIFMFVLFEL